MKAVVQRVKSGSVTVDGELSKYKIRLTPFSIFFLLLQTECQKIHLYLNLEYILHLNRYNGGS